MVLEYLDGEPEFSPANVTDMVQQMATALAHIHRVVITREFDFMRRRHFSAERHVLHPPELLDATLDEPGLRSALMKVWPWHQHNADALLHGDFWPGNLLWSNGKLVGVLDWEGAAVGDPLADVAVSRLDILWAFGETPMHTFTECYREQTQLDWRNLARWDLLAALRPMSNLARWAQAYVLPPICRPDITEQTMRDGHRRFVGQALRNLGIDRQT